MKKIILVICASVVFSTSAHAAFVGFASSTATNSADWITSVTSLGAAVNSNLNFDTHPLGALQGDFYFASDGVTLSEGGLSAGNAVTFGAGPGQPNTAGADAGEGVHGISNYYSDLSTASSLTINFDRDTFGGGLFVIDLFNPASFNESSTLAAYTGVNGTGSLLGTVSAADFNFQTNNSYFFGVLSTDNDIRSLVYTDVNGGAGDNTGIDNILFAQLDGVNPDDNGPPSPAGTIPEPSTAALLGLGLAAVVIRKARGKE